MDFKAFKKTFSAFIKSIQTNPILKSINSSKIFAGLVLLSLNLFSKFITIKLSDNQEDFIKNAFGRQLLIFSIAWLGTREVFTALGITAIFVVLADNLLNENSDFYILPKPLTKLKDAVDLNSDGIISDKEIETAINVLNKAKKQQEIINNNNIDVN
tara:strand:- start:36 stop:506 length:471 start_codon:yes stop_codon:yes gene_type:complete